MRGLHAVLSQMALPGLAKIQVRKLARSQRSGLSPACSHTDGWRPSACGRVQEEFSHSLALQLTGNPLARVPAAGLRPFSGRMSAPVLSDDLHVLLIHFDPLHQRPHELTSGEPVRLMQSGLDLGGKCLQSANDRPEVGLQGCLIGQLLRLCFGSHNPLFQASDARLKVALLKRALGITIDQPRDAVAQLPQLRLQHCWVIPLLKLRWGCQAAPVCPLAVVRMPRQALHLVPDCRFQRREPSRGREAARLVGCGHDLTKEAARGGDHGPAEAEAAPRPAHSAARVYRGGLEE
jgi:hypothetical protein